MNSTLFKLYIIKNNSDYEDVAFKSDILNLNYKFASAFYIHHQRLHSFLRFPDDANESANKRLVFRHFLSLMLSKLRLIKRDHELYFPIDMDEDFTSVLKCKLNSDEEFSIQFGVIDQKGVGIDVCTLDPVGDVSKIFIAQTQEVYCEKEDLEMSVALNLLSLNKEAAELTLIQGA